jgi:hypothetical protein
MTETAVGKMNDKTRMMVYYENNKDKVKQKSMNYYYQNKDRIRSKLKEKVECPYCKSVVARGNLSTHQKKPKCNHIRSILDTYYKTE